MKVALIISVAMLSLSTLYAQNSVAYEPKSKQLAYEKIYPAVGNQQDIYSRMQVWMNTNIPITFEDHKRMFIGYLEDQYKMELLPTVTLKQTKEVGGKEVIELIPVRYKMKIWVRDGEFRVRISDVHIRIGTENKPIEKIWLVNEKEIKPEFAGVFSQFNDKIGPIIAEMTEYISKVPVVYNEDEW